MAVNSAELSAPPFSDWARDTIELAMLRSTCCMSLTVPDCAAYHCPGACPALMPSAPVPMSRVSTLLT
jgi:hypothetical protein